MSSYKILKNKIIFGKYKLTRIIGKGSFGCVFQGFNINNNSEVAIKVEKKNKKYNLLEIESNFLVLLKGFGIPEIKGFGYSGNFYILIQELLGDNLMQIHQRKGFHFSLKDISMIGIQIMDRIEYVHSKYIIHRDIKPENFVIGYKNNSLIYIIDFGISRKYKSSHTGKHLKYSLTGKMFGTVRYASFNASRGVEQSRRDDLESIGYMLVYLATGCLPWKGISLKDKNRERKYREMLLSKKYSTPEDICRGLPIEFAEYIKYCKKLSFEQDPDYEYLRNLFKQVLIKMNQPFDMNFSFNIKKSIIPKKNSKDIKLNKDKYINLFKRKESPHKRLFKEIQISLEKKEKNSKSIDEKDDINNKPKFGQKNMFSIKKINKNNELQQGGISDNATQNSKLDTFRYSNCSKTILSYNSLVAQYNMDVFEFEDENKLLEQNSIIINNIKNKKNKKFYSQKNRKIANFNDYYSNNIDFQTYNFNNKTANKSSLDFISYSNLKKKKIEKLENIKKKLNISLDLDKQYLIKNSLYDSENIRSKSEKIKNNSDKNIQLTKKELRRQSNCLKIYINIINKAKLYIDSLFKKNNNIIKGKEGNFFYTKMNNINIKGNYRTSPDTKYKPYSIEENFTFKNLNLFKNPISGNKNIYKNINMKRNISDNNFSNKYITNTNIPYKNLNIKNEMKRNIINNKNNNFNINEFLKKQNVTNTEKNINIIINNNINSLNKPIINNNNSNRNQNLNLYYHLSSNSENNIMSIEAIKHNNNDINKAKFNENNNKNSKYINKIPIGNNNGQKEKVKIILNKKKQISKGYIDNMNNTLDKNIYTISSNNKLNKNDNNYFINKNIPNRRRIKILEYKPIYNNTQTINILEKKNVNNINKNYFSNINILKKRDSNIQNQNKNLLSSGKMKIIALSKKNQVKIPLTHISNSNSNINNATLNYSNNFTLNNSNNISFNNTYFNNNNVINRKEINSFNINKKFYNNPFSNNSNTFNIRNNILNKQKLPQINKNQKIYLKMGKIKFQKSSDNIFNFLDRKSYDNNKYIIKNRNNSYEMKEKYLNSEDVESLNNYPKNIKKFNATTKNNLVIPKFF